MISMMTAPSKIPMTVPSGPATGRKVLPGIMNAPQPTAQPRESAQAPSRGILRRMEGEEVLALSVTAIAP